jgi:PLP dependent protein
MGDIAANLEVVRERIARTAERSGREAGSVTLVAVTKGVAVGRIVEAVDAGVAHLGENRVQEARAKYAPRGTRVADGGNVGRDDITLHMIGSLQRNKAGDAASLFDWVQSVDRPELAEALEKAAAAERAGEALPVLLQVNVTGEASKSGVAPEGLARLADAVAACPHLRGSGLMAIARMDAGESELRRTFATMRELLEGLRRSHPGDWLHLSMGMSDDYEIAIEEGATMVRVGRAIFSAYSTTC